MFYKIQNLRHLRSDVLQNSGMKPILMQLEDETRVDFYYHPIPLPKTKIQSYPVPVKKTPTPVLLLFRITPTLVPLPFWRSATKKTKTTVVLYFFI